jgi:tetratricopeptide (TPR) repeat protein
MGAGLSALNAGRLSEARTHLEKAQRMRPGNAEVAAALQRAADTGSGRSLAELEQRAARLASEERWTEALAIYDEALARDSSLQFAIDGRAAVAPRSELGKRLQTLIDRPERLAEDSVRGEAERLLARAKALPNQGPVIRSQVSRLELLLPTFNQPVMLALESDNATEVAIQRVGFFGAFDRREVTLKPGKYTVTGKRSGFRDVRREITVAPGQAEQTIVIRCLEPI